MENKTNIKHVAFIMDGNGRWAKARNLPRHLGHKEGCERVTDIYEECLDQGIEAMSLYAFSTENWNRPQTEVDALMEILSSALKNNIDKISRNNVRLIVIGDWSRLSDKTQENLRAAMKHTEGNTGLKLVLAISYSSRWEIIDAVKKIASDAKENKININDINDDLFSNYLTTKGIPDPDLLIRTSGEYRISNFLMWQLSYSELYFTDICWPDFKKEQLYEAIIDYQKRERRFGKTSEQLS